MLEKNNNSFEIVPKDIFQVKNVSLNHNNLLFRESKNHLETIETSKITDVCSGCWDQVYIVKEK